MSSRPKRFSASATIAATSASLATSQRTKAMPSPWPCALATASVSAPLASLRSATTTLAPSARKRMTVGAAHAARPAGHDGDFSGQSCHVDFALRCHGRCFAGSLAFRMPRVASRGPFRRAEA